MQICLYNIDQPMLILLAPSGVSYFNQMVLLGTPSRQASAIIAATSLSMSPL
jgi:hypothetical protein